MVEFDKIFPSKRNGTKFIRLLVFQKLVCFPVSYTHLWREKKSLYDIRIGRSIEAQMAAQLPASIEKVKAQPVIVTPEQPRAKRGGGRDPSPWKARSRAFFERCVDRKNKINLADMGYSERCAKILDHLKSVAKPPDAPLPGESTVDGWWKEWKAKRRSRAVIEPCACPITHRDVYKRQDRATPGNGVDRRKISSDRIGATIGRELATVQPLNQVADDLFFSGYKNCLRAADAIYVGRLVPVAEHSRLLKKSPISRGTL